MSQISKKQAQPGFNLLFSNKEASKLQQEINICKQMMANRTSLHIKANIDSAASKITKV